MPAGEIEHGLFHHHEPVRNEQKCRRRARGHQQLACLLPVQVAGSIFGSDESQSQAPAAFKRPGVIEPIVDYVLNKEVT
jgi:hypothetical protein